MASAHMRNLMSARLLWSRSRLCRGASTSFANCRTGRAWQSARGCASTVTVVQTTTLRLALRTAIIEGARDFRRIPFKYLSVPLVAAFVGWSTNYVGVKMLFYPIETLGPELWRREHVPYGILCWQGVVPTKAEPMAQRLTDIVTRKLLSLSEAFGRLDATEFAALLQPAIEDSIKRDAPNGELWAAIMRPFLPFFLRRVVLALQRDIENVLDLQQVTTSAFLRDKRVLVELFQEVGHAELDFLVHSGLLFGFILGFVQMFSWGIIPQNWTLPVAGALVGYITNWIAIKLVFDPVEPIPVGPFILQGMFEKRQPEVSDEFAAFLATRVLTSPRLIDELANGNHKEDFERLLRRTVPFVVPDAVVQAACNGLRNLVSEPESHPVHAYMHEKLGIEATLRHRLRLLPSPEFENLLHPVFQEDEIILIMVGGVLGFMTGWLQYLITFRGASASGVVLRGVQLAVVRHVV